MNDLHVLYVEDSEHDTIAVKRTLKKAEADFAVYSQASAEEALEWFQVHGESLDVVISDHNLPKMKGLELLTRLKELNPKVATILVTGVGDENLAVRALKSGITDYLVKDSQQAYLKLLPLVIQDAAANHYNKLAKIRAEEELKKSLQEKEILMFEIHHRVKNNLSVISSLLSLKASQSNDEQLKAALYDSQNRIHSMSTIHEMLYSSKNLAAIDMQSYFTNLSNTVINNLTGRSDIELLINCNNLKIGVKQSSALGLIVNELITNSIKHAFEPFQRKSISIQLKQDEQLFVFCYHDNGKGIPEDIDLEQTGKMGLNLVKLLAETQLKGSLEIQNQDGARVCTSFSQQSE